jgi:hypothetical protein
MLLSGFQGMMESGFQAVPFTRKGTLQTALVLKAMKQPSEMGAIAGFGWLLARESGFNFFLVRLERELPSGMQTSMEELKVRTVDEARAAIEALPDVARIKDALRKKLGIPPGIG